MRRFLWSMAAFVAATFGWAGLPLASADDKKDDSGWVQLFNGKDLTGWKIHPKPSGSILEVIPKEQKLGRPSSGVIVAYYGKLKDGKEVPLWRVEEGILIGSGPAS